MMRRKISLMWDCFSEEMLEAEQVLSNLTDTCHHSVIVLMPPAFNNICILKATHLFDALSK